MQEQDRSPITIIRVRARHENGSTSERDYVRDAIFPPFDHNPIGYAVSDFLNLLAQDVTSPAVYTVTADVLEVLR